MVTVNKIKPEKTLQRKFDGSIVSIDKPVEGKKPTTKRKIEVDPWGSQHIKILLYGKSGTGKTTLWSTFPGPILALICSGGLQPGELKSIDTPENRKRITPRIINSSQEIVEICKEEGHNYRTVVLDHATGFQDLILKEILEIDEIPVAKSWGIAKQQDWMQVTIQCKEILRCILSLDTNLVIIAQEREFKSEDASFDQIMPSIGAALTPNLTGWVNTAVDYLGNTFIRAKEIEKKQKINDKIKIIKVKTKEVEYCLRTGPHEIYQTKFRSPRKGVGLPNEIINPTYEKIIELI